MFSEVTQISYILNWRIRIDRIPIIETDRIRYYYVRHWFNLPANYNILVVKEWDTYRIHITHELTIRQCYVSSRQKNIMKLKRKLTSKSCQFKSIPGDFEFSRWQHILIATAKISYIFTFAEKHCKWNLWNLISIARWSWRCSRSQILYIITIFFMTKANFENLTFRFPQRRRMIYHSFYSMK